MTSRACNEAWEGRRPAEYACCDMLEGAEVSMGLMCACLLRWAGQDRGLKAQWGVGVYNGGEGRSWPRLPQQQWCRLQC